MIKDRRGEILSFVAFRLPLTLFILLFTLTYGLAEHAKINVITAAREGARTYAVTHDKNAALQSVKQIVENTMAKDSKYFNPDKDVVLADDGEFATCTVTYRVPVVVPQMFYLIGSDKVIGNYMPQTATARFIREAEPPALEDMEG